MIETFCYFLIDCLTVQERNQRDQRMHKLEVDISKEEDRLKSIISSLSVHSPSTAKKRNSAVRVSITPADDGDASPKSKFGHHLSAGQDKDGGATAIQQDELLLTTDRLEKNDDDDDDEEGGGDGKTKKKEKKAFKLKRFSSRFHIRPRSVMRRDRHLRQEMRKKRVWLTAIVIGAIFVIMLFVIIFLAVKLTQAKDN